MHFKKWGTKYKRETTTKEKQNTKERSPEVNIGKKHTTEKKKRKKADIGRWGRNYNHELEGMEQGYLPSKGVYLAHLSELTG